MGNRKRWRMPWSTTLKNHTHRENTVKNNSASRNSLLSVSTVMTGLLVLSACGGDSEADATGDGEDYGLNESGEVTVAYVHDLMPYTGTDDDGELEGAEGDLFVLAAEELGLEVNPEGMEFDAFLAGIHSNRYDIGIGGVSWTADRAEAGVMSDPVYYSPVMALSAPGVQIDVVDDLDGLNVGAMSGTTTEQGLRNVQGADVTPYPNPPTAFADLEAGRIETLIIDPLLSAYMAETRPDLDDYVLSTMEAPGEEDFENHPGLEEGGLQPYQVVWYCSPQTEALCDELNGIIGTWYEDGTSAEILAEYGTDDPSFFTALERFQTERQGEDRPEDWEAPTTGELIEEDEDS